MASAVSSISDVLEGKLSDDLSNFLSETFNETSIKKEKLIVADPKLGTTISKKLGIQVLSEKIVVDLYRGIRQHLDSLITGMNSEDISSMALGLSHSLSRHKLKFSPDKVDTMIIQAIGLLDDLDKELNTYAMRVKEWYGSQRSSMISMGTEISDEDINNIIMGCDQVISLTVYRTELYDYLKSRMMAIAPNLTTIVGELVGARLISHAGSLLNLAKHPSSTVQILGAEKALFRALKTKNATPKYGLIYHASLVGQASPKNKGKVARLVASKSSLATRFDAIADEKDLMAEMGHNCRKIIETRLRILEKGGTGAKITDKSDKQKKQTKFELISTKPLYNPYADIANEPVEAGPSGTKAEESEDSDDSQMDVESEDSDNEPQSKSEGKKPVKKQEIKASSQGQVAMEIEQTEESVSSKKKEKKKKASEKQASEIETTEESVSSKKKEKKKKTSEKRAEVETHDITEESVSKKKKKKASEKQVEVETPD
ncbi:16172_t:CDS:2, partial [Racocetra persica]